MCMCVCAPSPHRAIQVPTLFILSFCYWLRRPSLILCTCCTCSTSKNYYCERKKKRWTKKARKYKSRLIIIPRARRNKTGGHRPSAIGPLTLLNRMKCYFQTLSDTLGVIYANIYKISSSEGNHDAQVIP